MTASMPLEKMSVEEKLQAMESLWDDLRERAADNLSPSWHGDELAIREEAITRGSEKFEPWENAREHIRKTTG